MPGPWEKYQAVPADAPQDGPRAKYGKQSGADIPAMTGTVPAEKPDEPGVLQQIGRQFAMAGRNVAHGAMSIPGLINDPIVGALNYGEEKLGIDPKYRFGTAAQATDAALNAAGVPDYQPQNGTERVVGGVERALGSLLGGNVAGAALKGTSSLPAQAIGKALTENQGQQLAAAGTGSALGEGSREMGASPAAQAALSVAGGLTPAAAAGSVRLAGAAARGLSDASPEAVALAQKAVDAGIPLKASQIADSKVGKLIDSVTGQVPFSGAQKFQNTQQEAFNRAVGQTFGADSPKITSQVFAQAKQALNNEFERLTSQNNLALTPQVLQKLQAVAKNAGDYYGGDAQAVVNRAIKRVIDQSQSGVLPGKAYQSIDSEIGRAAASGGEKSVPLGDLREALRDAMDQSIRPEDASAWANARTQWRDLKTVEPLVAADNVEGNISPAKLLGRVTANGAGKSAMAAGRRGDLGDLAAIGQRFIKDRVPDSGTAQRLVAGKALGALGAFGTGLGAGSLLTPMAGLGAAGTVVGASRLAQRALSSEALVNALLGRRPQTNPILEALGTSLNPTQAALEGQRQ
jgi:hypothetical protein